jgi:nitrate/nitrite transporter NarK
LLPAFPSKVLAVAIIAILGVSFSLVPAALWPSVPKIIDEKILGSAYCVIFWIQNIGLLLMPIIIGKLNVATGGYTIPMIVFASCGIAALVFGFWLKIEDKRKGYGLELPNVKK